MREIISAALACGSKPLVLHGEKAWLGGLDSNQDNQIQNLMYCQLYDLPSEGENKSGPLARPKISLTAALSFVNQPHAVAMSKFDFKRSFWAARAARHWWQPPALAGGGAL